MPVSEVASRLELQSILFATDFSSHSCKAFPFAFRFAQQYGATIHVAHVIPPDSPSANTMDRVQAGDDKEIRDTRTALTDFLESVPPGVRCAGLVEKGEYNQAFADMVRERQVQLVVIATRGRQGVEKFLLGSVAEQIMRSVPCPVMVVGPRVRRRELPQGEVEQIIYATDRSPAALHALPLAVALAHDFDARLVLLHVVPRVEAVPLDRVHARCAVEQEQLRQAECELMQLRLGLENLPHEPETVVLAGQPGDAIPEIAANLSAGLIVIGMSHKRLPTLRAHLPCTVCHQVVSRAPCPVLIVPQESGPGL